LRCAAVLLFRFASLVVLACFLLVSFI
jgi:hypothetical protein